MSKQHIRISVYYDNRIHGNTKIQMVLSPHSEEKSAYHRATLLVKHGNGRTSTGEFNTELIFGKLRLWADVPNKGSTWTKGLIPALLAEGVPFTVVPV